MVHLGQFFLKVYGERFKRQPRLGLIFRWTKLSLHFKGGEMNYSGRREASPLGLKVTVQMTAQIGRG
jgi:hypothetical protein